MKPSTDFFISRTRWTATAIGVAVSSMVLTAAILLWPAPRVPLDASFPAAPTAADLALLRQAYSGPPSTWPKPRLLPDAAFTEMAPLVRHTPPEGDDRKLAQLGAALFEDPLLSASGHFSCQSCHNRRLGWGDGLPTSFGHGRAQGRRNAPALFNAGYKSTFFWDGRATSLEEQALGPLVDGSEMANHDLVAVLDRLNSIDRYRTAFADVTGRETVGIDDVTAALAAFQRTLERRTRFDRFMEGEEKALTDAQIWGLHLFRTKAGCANCHSGPSLSDGAFHNLGLSFFNRSREDLGRYEVTANLKDVGRFLTPSLRHVGKTAPYMHNGIFPTLTGVVRLYEAGGGRVRADQQLPPERKALLDSVLKTSPQLKSFELSDAERAALVAYLNAL